MLWYAEDSDITFKFSKSDACATLSIEATSLTAIVIALSIAILSAVFRLSSSSDDNNLGGFYFIISMGIFLDFFNRTSQESWVNLKDISFPTHSGRFRLTSGFVVAEEIRKGSTKVRQYSVFHCRELVLCFFRQYYFRSFWKMLTQDEVLRKINEVYDLSSCIQVECFCWL